MTDCKGVAAAAHGCFIAPQLLPLKQRLAPTAYHVHILTMLLLHVCLQIGLGKCKIALVAFVLLPPKKPAAHTYCNSSGNNRGFSAPEWVGLNLVVTVSSMGIGIIGGWFLHLSIITLISSAHDPYDDYNPQRLLRIVH